MGPLSQSLCTELLVMYCNDIELHTQEWGEVVESLKAETVV